MKSKYKPSKLPKTYGIIVTSLMLLIFGTKLIGLFIENGIGELKEIANAFVNWYDDPTAFFFSYLIGYAIIWWKPLWGSVIIIIGSLLVSFININNVGFIIFAIPTFLVGVFYIESWYGIRKRNKNDT